MKIRLFLLCVFLITPVSIGSTEANISCPTERHKEQSIHWGVTFDRFIRSRNVPMHCSHYKNPTCCAFSDDDSMRQKYTTTYSHQNREKSKPSHGSTIGNCELKREYIQSEYEKKQFLASSSISSMTNDSSRRKALIDFIEKDIEHSKIWLDRVLHHMQSGHIANITTQDEYYLSRFLVTKTCGRNSSIKKSWQEWIEPLTIHGRHPLGLVECGRGLKGKQTDKDWLYFYSTDHILIQSGASFNTHGTRFRPLHKHENLNNLINGNQHNFNFIFDVGSSTFDSSLVWFICAYLQRKLEFHQIYAWEATLLEPNEVWKRVPTKLLPLYHFLNIPVGLGDIEYNAVLNMIEQTAVEDDFVALKLDIDTPHVEIPIALELAQGGRISHLIDEFFFELHFRCDLMMECGWGKGIPKIDHGLTLDRPSAMELFRKIRELGIRSHYWP